MNTEEVVTKMEARKRYETYYWAGALIWAGLMFGAESLGVLPKIGNADAWTWIFFGIGLYGTAINIYATFFADLGIATTGDYLWSGFWLLVGLSGFFVVDLFWPIALILVGVVVATRQLLAQSSGEVS